MTRGTGMPRRLLVVEDDERHMEDATEVMRAYQGLIIPEYAKAKDQACALIQTRGYDGVISDIFMPSFESGVSKEDREACYMRLKPCIERYANFAISSAAKKWAEGDELPPLGVLVAEEASAKGIPVVFCTDLAHHAYKAEPVRFYETGGRKVVMVDVNPPDYDMYSPWRFGAPAGQTKDWNGAIISVTAADIFRGMDGFEGDWYTDGLQYAIEQMEKMGFEIDESGRIAVNKQMYALPYMARPRRE